MFLKGRVDGRGVVAGRGGPLQGVVDRVGERGGDTAGGAGRLVSPLVPFVDELLEALNGSGPGLDQAGKAPNSERDPRGKVGP